MFLQNIHRQTYEVTQYFLDCLVHEQAIDILPNKKLAPSRC